MTNSTNNRAHDNIRPSIGVSVAKSGQLKQYDFNASAPVQMNCRFNWHHTGTRPQFKHRTSK